MTCWNSTFTSITADIWGSLNSSCAFPSISALPEHKPDIRRAAEWVAGQLRTVGIEAVRIMETDGHPAV